jgi:ABC-type glycerol-3-phosphate transport system substrate-binding protein
MFNPSQATALVDITLRRHVSDEHYERLLSKEDQDYTHPDIVEAFRSIQTMADVLMPEGVAAVQADQARQLLAQEKAAIYSDASVNAGPGMLGSELPEDFELGYFFYPTAGDNTNRTIGYYDGHAIMAMKDTGKEEWAKEFIKFVVSAERQEKMGEASSNFPSRNDLDNEALKESYDEVIADMYEGHVEHGTHVIWNTIMDGEYRHQATPMIQGLVMGEKTPEEFAEEFTKMVQTINSK